MHTCPYYSFYYVRHRICFDAVDVVTRFLEREKEDKIATNLEREIIGTKSGRLSHDHRVTVKSPSESQYHFCTNSTNTAPMHERHTYL